jgi:hypothetical protein
MRAKQVFEFIRNYDPVKSLGLGYEAKIRAFFRQYDIDDEDYKVTETGEIIFNTYLYLRSANITELPDNLIITDDLCLSYSQLTNFPNNLTVNKDLLLNQTNITEFPNSLIVKGNIYVHKSQLKLINFINNSKFKNQLHII